MAADLILLMKWKRLQLTGGKAWRIIPEYLVKNISVWISTRGSVKKKKNSVAQIILPLSIQLWNEMSSVDKNDNYGYKLSTSAKSD